MTRCAKVKRPILRYHGGKWNLAPWIISNMPPHRIYVEPFGGGASVLMRKPRCYAEIYNDKWETVVNVFRVLRDPIQSQELRRLLVLTPYSRTEFLATGEFDIAGITDPVERARLTILRSFAGFGSAATNSEYATGFRGASQRSGTTPAHDWAHLPAHIESWVERLSGVTIENLDAAKLMLLHDTPATLFYVDPPYVHATRNMDRANAAYAHEMTDADHSELAKYLRELSGMVILSGYACDHYSELYGDWERLERRANADGARKRTECLWFNPAAWERRPQTTLALLEAIA